MIPELFRIGDFAVSPFGVLMALAFLAGYFQLVWGLKQAGLSAAASQEHAGSIVVAGGLGGVLGAKIYYAALYQDWRLLIDRSGLVWYGGFVLGAAAVLWTLKRRDLLRGWVGPDATAPALALGYAVGRLGCFLVGDDYGRPTDLPWGVAFPRGLPATTAGNLRSEFGVRIDPSIADSEVLRVHPTQIYETLAAGAICALGIWLVRRGARPGTVTLVTLGLLAVERLLVETVRAKDDRFVGPLTLAQVISLAIVVVVVALALRRRSRPA